MKKIIILAILAFLALGNVNAYDEGVTEDFLDNLIRQAQISNEYDPYLEMKKKREQEFQNQIMNLLNDVEIQLDELK